MRVVSASITRPVPPPHSLGGIEAPDRRSSRYRSYSSSGSRGESASVEPEPFSSSDGASHRVLGRPVVCA